VLLDIFIKYITPFLTIGAFTMLRLSLSSQPNSTFVGYSIFIFLHAWFGRFYSGVLAIGLSFLSGIYFFAPPYWQFKLLTEDQFYVSAVFILQSLIIAFITAIFAKKLIREVSRKHNLEIKESELKAIIDTVYGFIVLTDDKGVIIENNQLYQDFQLNKSKDLTGSSIYNTFPWKNNILLASKLNDLFEIAQERGSAKRDELLTIGKKQFYYDIQISKVKISSPELMNVFVVSGIDITGRKLYEMQLENVQQNYTKLIDSNIVGMTVTDLKGNIIEANDEFFKLISYKPEIFKSKGLNWLDIISKESALKEPRAIKALLARGYYNPIQNELVKSNGSKIRVLISGVLIDEKSQKILRMTVDLSAQQKIIDLKDEFVGMITHELKTPLMTLQGYIEMLDENIKNNKVDDLKKFTFIINRQTKRLTKLVADLIDFTKLSKDSLILQPEETDIIDLCKKVTSDINLINVDHKIIVKANRKSIFINIDAYRIEQVIINLLTNAIKFSKAEDKITITIQEAPKSVKVSVTDYGMGIAKDDLSKVFNKFFQSQIQPARSQKSLGLGLYISSEIIKKHKGKIDVDSEINKGTTFYFVLPK